MSKENLTWLAILWFLAYFNISLNAQRQAMALSACVLCVALLDKRKYVWTVLATFLAYNLHHSALLFASVLVLFYLIKQRPAFFAQKKVQLLMVVGIVVMLYSFNAFLSLLGNIGIGEDKYISRYGSSDEYGSNIPISQFALNTFNLVVYNIITKRHVKSSLYVFGKYMMILALMLCFSGLISTFAVRIVAYFLIINFLLLSHYLPSAKTRWKVATVLFYLFYWYMCNVQANLSDSYPYQSILGDIL